MQRYSSVRQPEKEQAMTIVEKVMDLVNGVGWSNRDQRGPRPGDGAVIHFSSGNADFDGLPGDVLPPRKLAPEEELCHKERPSL